MSRLPADEKVSIQIQYLWESLSAAISLNSVKTAFLAVFTFWYKKYREVYEFKIASLIFLIWLIRFILGTAQSIKRGEWTATQCRAGLYQMGGFCAFTLSVWAVSQVVGVNWALGTWLGAWLMVEFASLADKILPILPKESPLTNLVSSFIYFFHGRIENMSNLMSKLGRRTTKENIDENEKKISHRQDKIDKKKTEIDTIRHQILKLRKEINNMEKKISHENEIHHEIKSTESNKQSEQTEQPEQTESTEPTKTEKEKGE